MELRLFIAIDVPEQWTVALGDAQQSLRRRGLERLRWVRPEAMHLTLKFLGAVDAGRVAAVTEAMATAAGSPPFRLTLERLGAFGPTGRPRVLWAGVGGELAALDRLWRALDQRVQPLGFARERGRFSPHLTIARVPEQTPPELVAGVEQLLAAISVAETPPLTVREIALVRSLLGPGGARYEKLATAPLRQNSLDIG